MYGEDLRKCFDEFELRWGICPRMLVAKVNDRIRGFCLFSETQRGIFVGYIAVERGSPKLLLLGRMIEQLRRRAAALGDLPVIFEVRDPRVAGRESRRDQARIRSLF